MKLRNGLVSIGTLALAALMMVGCQTESIYRPPEVGHDSSKSEAPGDLLHVSDTVRVEFSNLSTGNPLPPFEEQIKENGTITPPVIGISIQAAGKSPGQLQKELQAAYDKYFVGMTVTVKAPDRFYSVGGQVKLPNRQVYVGGTTVIKAIQSAGDLTDYANRKKIQLTRANGKTYIINYDKALVDPKLDLPVYPGDSIHVPQRIW